MTMDEIHSEVQKLDDESKAIKKELYRLAWFMRGALSVDQAYQLDLESRELISTIIEDNLEITKKSNLPFF